MGALLRKWKTILICPFCIVPSVSADCHSGIKKEVARSGNEEDTSYRGHRNGKTTSVHFCCVHVRTGVEAFLSKRKAGATRVKAVHKGKIVVQGPSARRVHGTLHFSATLLSVAINSAPRAPGPREIAPLTGHRVRARLCRCAASESSQRYGSMRCCGWVGGRCRLPAGIAPCPATRL